MRIQIKIQERLPIGSRSSLRSHVSEHNRNYEDLTFDAGSENFGLRPRLASNYPYQNSG